MILVRSRWMPPVVLSLAIVGFSLLPRPQAPFESMQAGYSVISWADFVCGPLAVLLMVCSLIGLVSCRGKDGYRSMAVWFFAGLLALAAKPLLHCLFAC